MIEAYHGLKAYRGGKDVFSLLRKGFALEKIKGEVCIADKPIGTMGVKLYGELTQLFSKDCWSALDEAGSRVESYSERIWEGWHDAGFYSMCLDWFDAHEDEEKQKAFNSFCKASFNDEDVNNKSHSHYCEGFLKDPTVCQVWIKPRANRLERKAALALAKYYNVGVQVLEESTRTWGDLD